MSEVSDEKRQLGAEMSEDQPGSLADTEDAAGGAGASADIPQPYVHSKNQRLINFLTSSFFDFFFATGPRGEKIKSGMEKEALEFIAKEIAAEQTLITARMTWNLSFQGFLIAGYAVAIGQLDDKAAEQAKVIYNFINVIPFAGILTASAALVGILAAFMQINVHKRFWFANHVALQEVGPRPFSHWFGELLGRIPALVITATIIWAWLSLGVKNPTDDPQPPPNEQAEMAKPAGTPTDTPAVPASGSSEQMRMPCR
jgi:hypothetical protein